MSTVTTRAYVCDVVLYFTDQPSRQVYIGYDRKARDKDHAVLLAEMDAQAKGWNLDELDEVVVIGGKYDPPEKPEPPLNNHLHMFMFPGYKTRY